MTSRRPRRTATGGRASAWSPRTPARRARRPRPRPRGSRPGSRRRARSRRLAAQLEEHPLHGVGALPHQQLADGGRAGERDHVDAGIGAQHSGDLVGRVGTTFTTPAGMSVCSAISRPSRVAFHGVFGSRLEHDGVAGGQRRAELVEDDLDREVGRRDGRDDADRLLDDGAHVAVAEEAAALEDALPFELVDQLGRGSAALPRAASPVGRTRSSSPGSRPRRSIPHADRPFRLRSPTAAVRGTACAACGWSTSRTRRTHAARRRWRGRMSCGLRPRCGPAQASGRAEVVELGTGGGRHKLPVDQHPRFGARRAARLPSSTLVSVRSFDRRSPAPRTIGLCGTINCKHYSRIFQQRGKGLT